MTEILNGRVLAKTIRDKAKKRVLKLKQPPGLAVLSAGDDPASAIYVGLKETAAKEVGIYIEKFHFAGDATEKEIIARIDALNRRHDINGILVQLPLPAQDADRVVNAIDPAKDIDGFHPKNRALLLENHPGLVPPVSLAIMRMLQATRQPLANKTAVIVSNSEVFAEPLRELLREAGVAATYASPDDGGIDATLRAADIVVVAVGRPNFVSRANVKAGAIVVDVGTNKVNGKIRGDVNPDCDGHAGFMTPVPGGVGPLTVAYLLMNVIKAKELRERS